MIVIFKNEEGTYSVRPAFIGFIKNDVIRRILETMVYPLMLVLAIVLSLLQVAVIFPFMVLRAIYYPVIKSKAIRKTEIWRRPRTKNDKHNKMD